MRLNDMEQLLTAKKELLRQTEMALERERRARTEGSPSASHFSELAHLKNRCASLEQENQELRKICGGNRTPKYLPLSPNSLRQKSAFRSPVTDDSSPDDISPSSGKMKEVGFSGRDEDILAGDNSDLDTSIASGSGRPPRGFKKIFGKIKRSNSGGQLEDSSSRNGSMKRSQTPEFRRGGFRATAGGRIGGWNSRASERDRIQSKRPVSEWNVDMICTWMECLGLGNYTGEVKRTIGTGEQLAKMTYLDLESKLNVKNNFHRKKLYLGLQARQNPQRPDLEGNLDYQWVLRWLDDIGLPQYKDNFLDAKIDGRVLNVLTVDDLFGLKITNLLHHLSIKRGIEILRSQNFDSGLMKRRAIPGEELGKTNVSLWSNHRVMEWLKQVDLAEYAPNLRGSGVHGGLLVYEPRFNDDLMAALLSIPASKTLLRRHLSIHFKELVGREIIQEKRVAENDPSLANLTPTAKAKARPSGQFSLKRKKSRSNFDYGDMLCPFASPTANQSQHEAKPRSKSNLSAKS